MIKKLLLFFVFAFGALSLYAQGNATTKTIEQDSTLCSTTFYFRHGNRYWIDYANFKETCNLYYTYKSHSNAKIKIEAWADSSDEENENATISQERANTVRKYFLSEGVHKEDIILVKGYGVDYNAEIDSLARRADIRLILSVIKDVVVEEPKEVVEIAKEEPIDTTKAEDARAAKPIEEIDTEMQVEPETKPEEIATEPTQQPEPTQTTQLAPQPKTERTCYIGAGLGFMPTWSTFTGEGLNLQAFTGVEFTELVSAELSVGYSSINMKSSKCCESLYYAEGNRYFAPVAGVTNYRYGDITSKVSLLHLTAKANFDLVSIWNKDSRWSTLVSPKIGYIHSSANLENITKESSSHFSAGADLSGGYNFNDNWGMRLTTGFEYITGKGIDGMPQYEHNSNTLWNTELKFIYKF